jgi:hypothetical protein
MTDEEAPWPRGLFAPSPVSVPDEAPSLYAETIRQRQEIERLEAEVAELAEENALIRKLANKYLAENTAIKEEVERMREALERLLDLVTLGASGDAFSNGVTDSTGTIDEGDVIAGCIIDEARAALAQEKTND